MNQIFVTISNDRTLHTESHFSVICWELRLSSGNQRQIVRDVSNKLLKTQKNSHILTLWRLLPGKMWNILGEVLKIMFLRIVLCSFNFRHCKLQFSSITLHEMVEFKWQHLFAVGATTFLSNQNLKYGCFQSAFQIFSNICLPVVYLYNIHCITVHLSNNAVFLRYCLFVSGFLAVYFDHIL